MNTKQNAFQNAFQNAGQLQSFSYNEFNVSFNWFVLALALIMLVMLLRSEARSRALLERLGQLARAGISRV